MITTQQAWDLHYANATSDDPEINSWNSPVYMASRNLFRAIARTEYVLTTEQAERLYALMVENGDTVAWNLDILREEIQAEQYPNWEYRAVAA